MHDEVKQPDNVVTLTSDAKATMDFPELESIKSYWDDLRGDHAVPTRSDIDPRQIGPYLDRAFILERLAPGLARFRLAGMHLNDLMGMEVRGMPLSCFFQPDAREALGIALEKVFTGPSCVQIALTGDRGLGKPPLDAVLLLLPLASQTGEVNRALGCLATLGPVGRAPRRFRIRHIQADNTERHGAAPVGWAVPEPEVPLAAGWAEDQENYVSQERPRPAGKPQLYLVKTDEGD